MSVPKVKFNDDLNPELLDYHPDFGFNDELNVSLSSHFYTVWQLLYDQVKKRPKFQRVRNLLIRRTLEKYKQITKMLQEQE